MEEEVAVEDQESSVDKSSQEESRVQAYLRHREPQWAS